MPFTANSTPTTPLAQAGKWPIAGCLLMLLSGVGGLSWQLLWSTQLATSLGHETVSVLGVLAAFFGGLSIGAWVLSGRIERSNFPGRWYAALEAVVALWGAVTVVALPQLAALCSSLMGAEPSPLWQWTVAFGLPFFVLLPATAAMGATLPAVDRVLSTHSSQLGALYGANTLGAVAGVLLMVFVCFPAFGLQRTGWSVVALNAVCAVVAWLMWFKVQRAAAPAPVHFVHAGKRRLVATLFLTGLLGVGYEVLAVRVLSQVTENTIYSYALLLAVYLVGTALGAAWFQHRLATGRGSSEQSGISRAIWHLCVAVLLGGASLWWIDVLATSVVQVLGPGRYAALSAEALVAVAAMLLPTLAMGAVFTRLCLQAQPQGWPLGRALAINTGGAALAPLVVGVLLLPLMGAKLVLVGLAGGYLALTHFARKQWLHGGVTAAVLATVALAAPPLRFVDIPQDGKLLEYREGVTAAVSAVQDEEGVVRLRINNRAQEGSTASGAIEVRLAQIPLLLHPRPTQVLMLGLGTGFTAQAAGLDGASQVTAVELLPEVIAASALFLQSPAAPRAAQPVQVVAADARRYVQAQTQRYDVIVSDLFHPARSGAGALYTVEQFQAVRQRLAPGGLFCQWLALHQMDLATLRSITAAFLAVYPQGMAVLASNSLDTPVIGLIARPDAPLLSLQAVTARLKTASKALQPALAQARLNDEWAILGSVIAGPKQLALLAAGARPNTDDRPSVALQAPWDTYAPQSSPRQRLAALLQQLQPAAQELLAMPSPATPLAEQSATSQRLQAYWTARNRYIALGMSTRPSADPRAMLAQLQDPLISILNTSPDFSPALEPLQALSRAIRRTDPARADALTATLNALQTQRASP